MKLELNTTKEKLAGYLEVSQRIARQNASRSTKPEIEKLWSAEAADIGILIHELKHDQPDMIKK